MGWRVDYTLSSSLLRSVEEPMVHLQLEIVPAPGALAQPISMSLSADKFQVLLAGEAGPTESGRPPGYGCLGTGSKDQAGLRLASVPYHSPCHPLVPCRTEAGSDPDDRFGLRWVFLASELLPQCSTLLFQDWPCPLDCLAFYIVLLGSLPQNPLLSFERKYLSTRKKE